MQIKFNVFMLSPRSKYLSRGGPTFFYALAKNSFSVGPKFQEVALGGLAAVCLLLDTRFAGSNVAKIMDF
jgi:hypothetical protein